MKKIGLCFILMTFWMGAFAQTKIEKPHADIYLCITIPSHRSVCYGDIYYEVIRPTVGLKNDSLYR
jgi:hypothetical protein